MKRVRVPFPDKEYNDMSIKCLKSSQDTIKCNISKNNYNSNSITSGFEIITSRSFVNHQLSMELCDQLSEITIPAKIIQPGLIEVTIRARSVNGYNCIDWPVRIGGFGIINDSDINNITTSPICVRFNASISHIHIDDSGVVRESFWYDLSMKPTLNDIVNRLVEMLSSPFKTDDNITSDRWYESEKHTYLKQSNINLYRNLCKHNNLFQSSLTTNYLDEKFLKYSTMAMVDASIWRDYIIEISPNIYSFRIFTDEFCNHLIEEMSNFESTSLPKRRPNTMNKYGLILNDIGMESFMSTLLEDYISQISAVLFSNEAVAQGLDHHHSFLVEYKDKDGDIGLDMHHDASEVTFNLCLGKEFEGSGLKFCGPSGSYNNRKLQHTYSHKKGFAVLHLGRQRHGADNISSGHRINLIMWCRSSRFRIAAYNGEINPDGYPKQGEIETPDIECLSKTNDDDYYKELNLITNK